ncbi:hypothetical protein ACJJID_11505 [Microbulbifer sp. CnH-101-G]|uniref:hypothetical protein n=1 Tax=Microbulbifer sp. CnH-101-G TaxID=3243393 RepID=UPI004039198C
MRLRGNWDIDRVPTKKERIFTIVVSLIICTFTGTVSYFGVLMFLNGEAPLLSYSFFYVTFLISLWALIRACVSRASKPSGVAIMAVGSFLFLSGVALLFIPYGNAFQAYFVFVGLFGGTTIFLQGLRKLNAP